MPVANNNPPKFMKFVELLGTVIPFPIAILLLPVKIDDVGCPAETPILIENGVLAFFPVP